MCARKRKSPMKSVVKGITAGIAGACIAGIVVVMRRRRRNLMLRGTCCFITCQDLETSVVSLTRRSSDNETIADAVRRMPVYRGSPVWPCVGTSPQ